MGIVEDIAKVVFRVVVNRALSSEVMVDKWAKMDSNKYNQCCDNLSKLDSLKVRQIKDAVAYHKSKKK